MSLTLYRDYRRQNLRHAWRYAGMTRWTIRAVARTLVAIAGVIALLLVRINLAEAENQGRQHGAAERERLVHDSKMLAHIMNGGGLLDREKQTAFFFQVSKQEGL